ncbi:hypothetical protein BROUX41_004020 [Berkeleyomyces rouxiae]|uniref:uncharacterized protein n=1 Tax=Berkeleyomyces rouxiae TaxID=2035830 RepID=UPI003B7DB437
MSGSSTPIAREASEAHAPDSASLGMEQKPHEATGDALAANDSHDNSGTPPSPPPQPSATDTDDVEPAATTEPTPATNNSGLPPNPASAEPDVVDPIAIVATTSVIPSTSGPILHSPDKPEQIAAAILAATSSEIHTSSDAPSESAPEPASETLANTVPETAQANLQSSEAASTDASPPAADPASQPPSTDLAETTELPFVTPSTFLHRTPAKSAAAPNTTPAVVAAPLGSIAPPLLQHPVDSADHPPSPDRLVTLNDFTEPITPFAATFLPSEKMVQPQDGEPPSEAEYLQLLGLRTIRRFLKVRTSYDVLPMSFRLIVLDNNLLIKKSLNILIQNAIVSAPLWNAETSTFAGLLTATDYINVIQYYCLFPEEMGALEHFKLANLRTIEKAIGVSPIEDVSVKPTKPLYQALRKMLQTRARRIPLVDIDEETGRETVISVITQYRILKFIAVNNEFNTVLLRKSIKEIGLGTYTNLVTLSMDNTVLDAVHEMVQHNISSIPIVDKNNRVLNVFEAVDIIPCIQGGIYEELSEDIGIALCKRADESPGIYTCSEEDRLDSIFDTIRKSRVHRLVVVDDDAKLRGIISLSDILKYVLLHGEETDDFYSEEEDEQEIKRQGQIAVRYTQPQQK